MAKSEISRWMPIEIERFFASPRVQAMRDFQKWWYVALLMRAWQFDPPCHLPADDEQLRILAGAPPEKAWREYGKLVTDCFSAAGDSGLVANQAQLEIYERQVLALEKHRASGRKGAEARWRKNGDAMATLCDANTSTSISSSVVAVDVVSKEKPKPEKKVFELPVWIEEQVWKDFEAMRNHIGKRMTDRARQMVVNELKRLLDKGFNPILVLEQSIRNSWQDVYPLKESHVRTNNPERPPERSAAAIIAEREERQRRGLDDLRRRGILAPNG